MFMRKALEEAKLAEEEGEIPVGAVVVCKDRVIARAHNQTERLNDVTAHAEMLAITSATSMLGGKYLNDCTLYVTMEPCVMCGGIVCDGAKPSCAAKIAASVHAALLAHYMSMSDKQFQAGEGIVEKNVEETIKNMGYIGRVGMKSTDKEILNVMIDKADVDANLKKG